MFSIRWKLTLSYVILSVVTATAVGIIAFFLIKGYVDRKAEEELRLTAETIERQIRPLFDDQHAAEMRSLTNTLGMMNNLRIRVLDLQERLVMDTHPAGPSPMMRGQPRRDLLRQDGEEFSVSRIFSLPIREDGGVLGYLELQNPPGLADTTLEKSRLFFVIAGAIAAALAVLIGLEMGRRLTSPIVALTGTVGKMRDGDLTIRAEVERKDEIGELADQFNHLAERLEENFTDLEAERDNLKAFVENASHELRTPVTALQTFNELLLGRSGNDPDTRREFLRDSKKQIERLQWMVMSLLSLTRIDGDLVELDSEEIPVTELIEEMIRGNTQALSSKKLHIDRSSVPADATIVCDRKRLVIALSNIFDNAIKHSPEKGVITFLYSRKEESAIIGITDRGPGIDPADLPHIFERFYRARTSTDERSGLGLSLADSIVRLHGGTIEVESTPGTGTTFSIILPNSISFEISSSKP